MAWLNAKPKPPEGSRRAKMKVEAISRRDRSKRDGIEPPMPTNPAPHIVSRLIEIGLSEPAGMGVAPVSWLTIDAWQRVTGITLERWEARLMRRLSVDYVAESHRAEDETCPPPWRAEVTQREIETEAERLRMFFGSSR